MRDICLYFDDRAAWLALSISADPGELEIYEVGAPDRLVSEPMFEDGVEIAPPVFEPRTGWRVNILARDDLDLAVLDPFVTEPTVRLHRWAGIGDGEASP